MIINLQSHSGENGTLVPIELSDKIPFNVKRVYFLHSVPKNVMRGGHAHKIEKEVFLCVKGSCFAIIDSGNGKEKIALNSPEKAIFIDTMVWHEFIDFSEDCVLLALSSTKYLKGEQNYIYSYEEWKKQL